MRPAVLIQPDGAFLSGGDCECRLIGCTEAEAQGALGRPVEWFPSCASPERIGLWREMSLWFDGAGICAKAHINDGTEVLLNGTDLLRGCRIADRTLHGLFGDVIARKGVRVVPSVGLKLYWERARGPHGSRCAIVEDSGSASVRAEMLLSLAKRVAPRRREVLRMLTRWLADFPRSVASPPMSTVACIAAELDERCWSEALSSLMYFVSTNGVTLTGPQMSFVADLARELGCPEILEW